MADRTDIDGQNACSTGNDEVITAQLCLVIVAVASPVLIDVPMPIRTARLTIRSKESGDGAITATAVAETWEELIGWMRWSDNRDAFTAELMEIRNRHVMAGFLLRESIELIGIETQTSKAVVWCGFHNIDWEARQCDTGYWVRKSAQGQGVATETANAMVRYAFGALGMQRSVSLTRAAMKQAAASRKDLGSLSKGYSGGRTSFLVVSGQTGIAMSVWGLVAYLS